MFLMISSLIPLPLSITLIFIFSFLIFVFIKTILLIDGVSLEEGAGNWARNWVVSEFVCLSACASIPFDRRFIII